MSLVKKNTIASITLIGAGNVGHHLGLAFQQQGIKIHQVFSRTKRKATQLAKKIGATAVNDLRKLDTQQDLYILAVSDDAIGPVVEKLQAILNQDALVVHTSGASPSTLLQAHFRRFGVFYPLQSFSKDKDVNWKTVPFCVYAHYKQDRTALLHLAQRLSDHVHLVDDEQRAQLHLAAVFVNNFTNLCYQIGYEIVSAKNLRFEILLPLIQQTVDKIKAQPDGEKDPSLLQTGPAVRGDQATIERHVRQLEEQFPMYKEIYLALSNRLLADYHNKQTT